MRFIAQVPVISLLVALAGGRARADQPPSGWESPAPAQLPTTAQPQPPAQQPPPEQSAQQPQSQQPQPAPQQMQPAPPPPPPLPPPGSMPAYGPPPYGYGSQYGYGAPYGAPYNINAESLLLYQSSKKNGAIAVLLSLWIPGLGNIYADHIWGAVITWAAIIGGAFIIVHGESTSNDGFHMAQTNQPELTIGLLLIAGGFINSPIDAGLAVSDCNRALAQRLGIPPEFAFGVVPIRMDRNVAWGPGLSFRF
jgi:hypothetical protein